MSRAGKPISVGLLAWSLRGIEMRFACLLAVLMVLTIFL